MVGDVHEDQIGCNFELKLGEVVLLVYVVLCSSVFSSAWLQEQAIQSRCSVLKCDSLWEFMCELTPSHITHDIFCCLLVEFLR